MTKMTLSIGADWLNDYIADLVEEGRFDVAYKMASSYMAHSEISDVERCGLVMSVLSGTMRFADAGEGALTLAETSKEGGESVEALFGRLSSLESKLSDKEHEIDELSRKLLFIYDHLVESDSRALYDLCRDYYDEEGEHLYGEDCIPEEVTKASSRAWADSYDPADIPEPGILTSMPSVMDRKNDIVSDFLDAMHGTDEGKPGYGWLSPDGEFFEVGWGDHVGWAWDYVRENEIESINGIFDAGDLLVALGWVLVHNPMRGVGRATLAKDGKLTMEQKKFLFDYFTAWDKPAAADAAKTGHLEDVPESFDLI